MIEFLAPFSQSQQKINKSNMNWIKRTDRVHKHYHLRNPIHFQREIKEPQNPQIDSKFKQKRNTNTRFKQGRDENLRSGDEMGFRTHQRTTGGSPAAVQRRSATDGGEAIGEEIQPSGFQRSPLPPNLEKPSLAFSDLDGFNPVMLLLLQTNPYVFPIL